MMRAFLQSFQELGIVFSSMWRVFTYTWFLILPPTFWYLVKFLWKDHVQKRYGATVESVLLELIAPRNIEKSPLPMESVYAGFAGVQKSYTVVEEWIQGQLPSKFSLEMVSDSGQVHLYIRTQKNFRNLVEAHLYAQYPDLEIHEVPDYTKNVPIVLPNKDWDLWGTDFELTKPDLYPIKTYPSFEESVTGKMIDPMAGLIEAMGKIGPGQQIWFQLVIAPEKESWNDSARELIDKLLGRAKKKKPPFFIFIIQEIWDILRNVPRGMMFAQTEFMSAKEEKVSEVPLEFKLSPGERDIIKALETNINKNMFKTKMRFVYLGRRENFDKSVVSSFIGGIKQFNDMTLNGFKPNDLSKTNANYLFERERMLYRQRKIFRRYRDRDRDGVKFILSTAELATLFHLPDMQVVAPSLRRSEAKRSGAPFNLPIE